MSSTKTDDLSTLLFADRKDHTITVCIVISICSLTLLDQTEFFGTLQRSSDSITHTSQFIAQVIPTGRCKSDSELPDRIIRKPALGKILPSWRSCWGLKLLLEPGRGSLQKLKILIFFLLELRVWFPLLDLDPGPICENLLRLGELDSLHHLYERKYISMCLAGPAVKRSAIRVHIHRRVLVWMERAQSLENVPSPHQFDFVSLDHILDGIRITDPFEFVLAWNPVHLSLSLLLEESSKYTIFVVLVPNMSRRRPLPVQFPEQPGIPRRRSLPVNLIRKPNAVKLWKKPSSAQPVAR